MIKLSASSMKTFIGCPKKYEYQYLIKPNIPKKDWSFLEFGKCAHRALELFHEHYLKNDHDPSTYPSIMTKSFKQAYKEHDMKILKSESKELVNVVQRYLDYVKKNGMPPVLYNELKFNIDINGFIVRGFIDRIDYLGDGHYHVVDYKTNKNPRYLDSFQLLIYALAIREKFDNVKSVKGSYQLLKHDSRLKSWDFIDRDFDKTISKITKIGTHIDLGDNWVTKPTRLCDWCDYQKICENMLLNEDELFD